MLVLERKVLHRDMSRNNILMYPQHHSSTEPSSSTDSGFYTPERPLRFIDEVLQKPKYVLSSMYRRISLSFNPPVAGLTLLPSTRTAPVAF